MAAERIMRLRFEIPPNVTVRTHSIKEGQPLFPGLPALGAFTRSTRETTSDRASELELDIPEAEFEKVCAELKAKLERKGS